jgi:hypothetical protein
MERHGAKVGIFHDYLIGVPSLTRNSPKGAFRASGTFRPGAAISAVILGDLLIRVYAVNDDNDLVETAYNVTAWGQTIALTKTATDSGLAAIQFEKERGGPLNINVFFQPIAHDYVPQRWVWDGTKWGPETDRILIYPYKP